MSLSSTTSRNDYTGNGSVSSYSYNFKIFLATDLLITVADTSSPPVQTTLVLNTDYTVTGAGSVNGGSIALVNSGQSWLSSGNLKSGYHITIRRVRPLTQLTDVRNQGTFFPSVHEDTFDSLTMIDQQQEDLIDRSVKLPETLPSSTFNPTLPTNINQASVSLVTNASGNGFAAGPTASDIANAQSNATSAAASATAASTSATNAANSATAAAASATAASTSATAAATSGTNSANSASAASTSATNSANSATASSGSAAAASTSATNAASSATAASTAATNAANSATSAAASATAAQAAAQASGGGGGSLMWIEDANAPTPTIDNHDRIYLYQSSLAQTLYALYKVPTGYTAGNPVKIKFCFDSPDSSGTALMQTVSTLIRKGTDARSSVTNQRTSTNTSVTLGVGTVNIPQEVICDLSDSTGHINAVAVSPGDFIRIALSRGTDTGTSDLKVDPFAAEVTVT